MRAPRWRRRLWARRRAPEQWSRAGRRRYVDTTKGAPRAEARRPSRFRWGGGCAEECNRYEGEGLQQREAEGPWQAPAVGHPPEGDRHHDVDEDEHLRRRVHEPRTVGDGLVRARLGDRVVRGDGGTEQRKRRACPADRRSEQEQG